eukprot:s3013_g5.t1
MRSALSRREAEALIGEADNLSELDSEVGEPHYIDSSDEEGENTELTGVWAIRGSRRPDQPPQPKAIAPWRRPPPPDHRSTGAPNLADVAVTHSNPLLRRRTRAADIPRGTDVCIQSQTRATVVPIYEGPRPLICLDYDQVLDHIRFGREREDLYLENDQLHHHVKRILERVGRFFEIWVVSYCCSQYYRNKVRANCATLPGIARVIVTSSRAGVGGKFDSVSCQAGDILRTAFIVDDDKSVCEEWLIQANESACQPPAGIAVPRKSKAAGVTYYKNFGEALEQRLLQGRTSFFR